MLDPAGMETVREDDGQRDARKSDQMNRYLEYTIYQKRTQDPTEDLSSPMVVNHRIRKRKLPAQKVFLPNNIREKRHQC